MATSGWHGGEENVYAATAWPMNWSETPVFQRVYGRMGAAPGSSPGIEPRLAVAEAMELLHEDYAYEFQMGWNLWEWEDAQERPQVLRLGRLMAASLRMTIWV